MMKSPLLTNVLLIIVIVLLILLMAGQQSLVKSLSFDQNMAGEMPQEEFNEPEPGMEEDGQPSAHQQFNPTEMILAALVCPSSASLALSDPSCEGKDAKTRRDFVMEIYSQQLPISKIFDKVIEKFGMNALTQEAQSIRNARKPSK